MPPERVRIFPARNQPTSPKKHWLRLIIIDYLANSQIHGYKVILCKTRPYGDRAMWTLLAWLNIAFTVWLFASTHIRLVRSPTVTSQNAEQIAIQEVAFPAIVFCSENRISRQALVEYSEFILNATQHSKVHIGRTVEHVFVNLLSLGKMYDLRIDDAEFYTSDQVHLVLTEVYKDEEYPITDILNALTPKCENMLKRCKWLGRLADCGTLFTVRRTHSGRCCAFNYVRPLASELRRQTVDNHGVTLNEGARILQHGVGFGLVVLIDQQVDDYAFALHSNVGTRVLVFAPLNFPDQTSGATKERFLGIGEEMIMCLQPMRITGSDDIRTYDRRSRRCVFDDEIPLIYKNFYTHSECLLVCRLDDIRHFCGCIPPQFSDLYVNTSKCLMDDLPCLSRWHDKWFNFEPFSEDAKPLQDMAQLDGHCADCISRCTFTRYNVATSTALFGPTAFDNRRVDANFTAGIDAANHSIVNINFGRHKVHVYEQNSVLTWYEQLASFGGIASLTFGASFISLVEVLYFFTGRFGANMFRRMRHRKL